MTDPPDAYDEAVAAAVQHADAQNSGTKRARTVPPSLADIYVIGRDLQHRSSHKVGSDLSENDRFRAFFGCGANIALHVWLLMNQHYLTPQEAQLAHLLWALFFMHVYPSGKVACATAGGSNGAIDPKTLRKYVWPMIQAIASLEPHVVCIFCSDTFICLFLLTWCCKILFDNRFKNDRLNDCLLSVDGTDFQRSQTNRDWYSHKFKRSGLRYEVALSILGGDICWICGPWKPGVYNDVMIFREALATWLEPGERVEADDGYVGEAPLRVKCPKSMTEPAEKEAMAKRVRSRHETVNKRFKQWGILRQVFRNDLIHHRDVFAAICVITQLAIENGEPLFEVHYDDMDLGV